MELTLVRYSIGTESTLGLLFNRPRRRHPNAWQCYTLEDEPRELKVPGETCIPEGTYRITLRTEGGFHNRYQAKFPGIHQGMLWVRDVPQFEYVLIHCGNTDDDTAGCILVADGANNNQVADGNIGPSVNCYRRVYPPIASALVAGEDVSLRIASV